MKSSLALLWEMSSEAKALFHSTDEKGGPLLICSVRNASNVIWLSTENGEKPPICFLAGSLTRKGFWLAVADNGLGKANVAGLISKMIASKP
jgi:hypothetical protein